MNYSTVDTPKILLVTSIVIALFFATMMLLDFVNIETSTLGAIRGLVLIPLFLILLCLPIVIYTTSRKQKYKKRKALTYAAVISVATLITIFIMTFS